MVQGRGHLPGARQGVPRQQRRRHRRFPRTDRKSSTISATWASTRSGCCRSTRRRLRTTATTSPTTTACIPTTARSPTSAISSARRIGAHLRVITELVINHTSDQHPWFQAARRAPPQSSKRNYYVWSDTDKKWPETRIIFTDTEKSNWTWDPVAKRLLLAPLLLAPAGPQLRQPERHPRGRARDALLARHGRRRHAPRRDPVSVRARRHQQRKPAGDARGAEIHTRPSSTRGIRTASCSPRSISGRRTCANTSATATNATWRITSR